jgi:superfamily II DNA/RNA helicase
MLDPQRFCRGVPVKSHKVLDAVMVRRLKQDLREIGLEFPVRKTIQIDIDGLPADAPELVLPRLLDEYRSARAARLLSESRSVQNAAALVTTSLQKRLLSSIEAFARTLEIHRMAIERQEAKARAVASEGPLPRLPLLAEAPGADDDRAELPEPEVQAEEDAQMSAATRVSGAVSERERTLLREMTDVAATARHLPDPRVKELIAWIRENRDRRVLVFTEYTDTKRYLEQQLRAALFTSARDEARLATFHGGMSEDTREEIKRAFNADPAKHPLRILIATDAAREGVNLQNHCADLFHFDLPWNPSRMEQRNGRIDRKLQRSPEVRCHYFYFAQRPEDRVLKTLVRKTETIQRELGSLARVLESRVEKALAGGIRREDVDRLARQLESENLADDDRAVVKEELEVSRERKEALIKQVDVLRNLLAHSQEDLGYSEASFRDAISSALELTGAAPLMPLDGSGSVLTTRWQFPLLDAGGRAASGWTDTLDTLRAPRRKEQKPWEWRRESPPRPIVFDDPGTLDGEVVHLHLSHRVVQRLLGRFLAHGFVDDGLTRTCLLQTHDAVPRVVLLGRLSLYGEAAARLHDELLFVPARWIDPEVRQAALTPYAQETSRRTLQMLQEALAAPAATIPAGASDRLLRSAPRDADELAPWLGGMADRAIAEATQLLTERGSMEAFAMEKILDEQRAGIEKTLKKHADPNLSLPFSEDERRQLEADRRHWDSRLASLADERVREPERIRASYRVKAKRLEAVGLVYLWPASG